MNKIVLVVFIFCVCQGIDAYCTRRCGEPMTRYGCETCGSCPIKECGTCGSCPIKECGTCGSCPIKECGTCGSCPIKECGTCGSCPIKECGTCGDMTPCSMSMNKCRCNSYLDPQCECLKAMMRFPDVEYPMSIAEMKPYYSGCGRCL